MNNDDPVLAMLQRQVVGLDTIIKRIDELEALLHQLFARLRQIETEHARLIAESPVPPPALGAGLNIGLGQLDATQQCQQNCNSFVRTLALI